MNIVSRPDRLTPLPAEQVEKYHENRYIIVPRGCHDDFIDMFHAHIHTIRSKTDIAECATPPQIW